VKRMDNGSIGSEYSPKGVIAVITRNIKPGREKDYDDWLRRYMILENKVPGYLGTTIIAPGGNTSSVRYIINRFSDKVSMGTWESSAEALKLIEEANNYSTIHYTSATGLETWFSVPDLKTIVPPPKWKMAIVAFIGAFCISSIARYIVGLYFGLSPLLTNVLMNIILVLGLTYLMMPILSKLLRRWLYPPIRHSQY
jgi:antibiotic biosynthesis monooxygenase (ABM) superfamily enzyme